MQTDWNLVRSMMNTAIDSCEAIEAMGYAETHRGLRVDLGEGSTATVFDFMVSAWTFPESMRQRIVRERHDLGADQPYVPETARILVAMAAACAELVGAKEAAPADAALQQMLAWYREHALPHLRRTIEGAGDPTA